MIYQNNREELAKVIRERTSIRHVSKHRNPDGSIDIEGNLKLWNALLLQTGCRCYWIWGNILRFLFERLYEKSVYRQK